ncbi:hypothetical protein ACXC9Q_32540 [Kribbella sp. CWNU-51]
MRWKRAYLRGVVAMSNGSAFFFVRTDSALPKNSTIIGAVRVLEVLIG